jgi:predicted PurR-regulated permease PerM
MNASTQRSPVRTAIEIAVNLLLIFVILAWCLQIVRPFIPLIVWAAVIAIAMYKPFLKLQALLGGSKKLALVLFTVAGLAVVLVPAGMFVGSIVDSAQEMTTALETGEFNIEPPDESVKEWPLVGNKVYTSWSSAASNFEAWLVDNKDVVTSVVSGTLKRLAGIGIGALQFAISALIAAAFLANAKTIAHGMRVLFRRLVGEKADSFIKLSTATITSVAVGVLGISFIQSFLGGLGMVIVGVPAAGVITLVLLVFCIAQLPPWLVMFPVIAYVFSVESTTTASIFAVWGVIVSFLDMVLKPLLMGRGVDAPMLVVLLGAIGGMLMSGIIGLFVGAVVLTLGYKMLEAWLVMHDDDEPAEAAEEA